MNDQTFTSVREPPSLNPSEEQMVNWADKSLWIVIGMILLGHLARNLVSDEPFNLKKFIGEMVLAGIGAVVIYLLGVLQGMPPIQIILVGCLTSLGGVRVLVWTAKIYRLSKNLQ